MKKREIIITRNNLVDESPVITEADYNEFIQAKTYGERMQILLAHSQRNNAAIRQRSIKMEKTQEQIEQEMLELNGQFREFLRERNIFKKFKIAFANMGESARRQHEQDKANLQALKAHNPRTTQTHEETEVQDMDTESLVAAFNEFLKSKSLDGEYSVRIEE